MRLEVTWDKSGINPEILCLSNNNKSEELQHDVSVRLDIFDQKIIFN